MFLTIEQLKAQTPSQRLQFALDALEEAEKSPVIGVSMIRYHSYESTWSKCYACLGGCAAIKAYQGHFNKIVTWDSRGEAMADMGSDYVAEFEASLDSARKGYIQEYLSYFNIKSNHDDMKVAFYGDGTDSFKQDMRKVIDYLKSKGL